MRRIRRSLSSYRRRAWWRRSPHPWLLLALLALLTMLIGAVALLLAPAQTLTGSAMGLSTSEPGLPAPQVEALLSPPQAEGGDHGR